MTTADLKLQDYIQHMLEATRLARQYVVDKYKSDFLADRRTQQAVVLNLITLGEIATRLMNEHPDFAASNPDLPSRQMPILQAKDAARGRGAPARDGGQSTIQRELRMRSQGRSQPRRLFP